MIIIGERRVVNGSEEELPIITLGDPAGNTKDYFVLGQLEEEGITYALIGEWTPIDNSDDAGRPRVKCFILRVDSPDDFVMLDSDGTLAQHLMDVFRAEFPLEDPEKAQLEIDELIAFNEAAARQQQRLSKQEQNQLQRVQKELDALTVKLKREGKPNRLPRK